MRGVGKRAAALLALTGLTPFIVPFMAHAQTQASRCAKTSVLTDTVSVSSELFRDTINNNKVALDYQMILRPLESVSRTDPALVESDYPTLTLRYAFASGYPQFKKFILSGVSQEWDSAVISFDGQEQYGERQADGTISFTRDPLMNYLENPKDQVFVRLAGRSTEKGLSLNFDRAALRLAGSNSTLRSMMDELLEAARAKRCAIVQRDSMKDCFLTTASCEVIGLEDDCWELRTLRRFRDEWLVNQDGGRADIDRYYAEAPAIAQRLRRDPASALREYWRFVLPSALAASAGANTLARRFYTRGMARLARAQQSARV